MQVMKNTSALQAWQVSVGGICGLVLTLGLARFAYTPLLPALQAQTGLGDAAAGLLAALNYAGYMSGALAAAWLDHPRWRHRLYSSGLWMALLSTAAMALSSALPWWALLRYIGGLCGATGMLFGSGLVLGWLMQQGRRPELGVHFIGIGVGIVFTAAGAAWFMATWDDWHIHWLMFALLGLLFFIPAWRWRPPVPASTAHRVADAPMPGRRWMITLALSYFAAGWGFVMNATFTVAMVERSPGLAGQGPWAWALVGLAAMPAVFLWDRVARRLGDRPAMMLAFALQMLATALPVLSGSLWAALLGALGYGATFIALVSLTLSLVGRHMPANPGKAMARLTLSYGLAQVLAPIVTGWMAQSSGGQFTGAVWLTVGVLGLGLVLLSTLPETHAAARQS